MHVIVALVKQSCITEVEGMLLVCCESSFADAVCRRVTRPFQSTSN